MSPELFQDFMVFVPGVTQGNEDAGSVQDFILLFFWCKSGEFVSRGSPRFLFVAPVVENFSSDVLLAIITYWEKLYLESCQTYMMELIRENS